MDFLRSSLGETLVYILIAGAIFAVVFILVLIFSGKLEVLITPLIGKYRENLEKELEILDTFPMTARQFILLQGGLGFGAFAIGLLTGPDVLTKIFMGSSLSAGLIYISRMYIREQQKKRKQRFEEQFAEAAALIGNAVKSGLSLLQALEMVVKEMGNPISYEFKQVLHAYKVGVPLDNALVDLSEKLNSVDLDVFVTAVSIQRETGGNLTEILDTLGKMIRERRRIQGQISALTAQGRLSSYVMSGLPVVMFVALYFINPQRVSLMFSHPLGIMLLSISTVTITIGIIVVRKMVDIDI